MVEVILSSEWYPLAEHVPLKIGLVVITVLDHVWKDLYNSVAKQAKMINQQNASPW